MKYFTKEFPKADNNRSLSKAQQRAVHRRFLKRCQAYEKQLRKLEGRVSSQAWKFFCLGLGRWGLHDAHLLSFAAGDGLDHPCDGRVPFRFNREKARVRILILNRHQNLLCSFECRDIRRVVFDYPTNDPLWNMGRLDHLLTYELTAVNKRHLRLEFLFSSGAIILVEFARMIFRRRRVRRRFPVEAAWS